MDPNDPVYPSNLSAALYELANYAECVKAVLRAWTIIKPHLPHKADLIVRLSIRLGKALCNGVRGGAISSTTLEEDGPLIHDLEASSAMILSQNINPTSLTELAQVWREWKRIERLNPEASVEALRKFSQLQILTPPL